MYRQLTRPAASSAKRGVNKLVLSAAALVATAIIGTTGVAMATPSNGPKPEKPCPAGFKNYGQCVKPWAHGNGGGGYNGNINIGINIGLNNSNNNTITIILRPIINIFR